MDIGREVRRYRAEPVISPVPGAEAPVEESAAERTAFPVPDVEPAVAQVDVTQTEAAPAR